MAKIANYHIDPNMMYACETHDRMYWQHGWVNKSKFKGALLSGADDREDVDDIIKNKVIHGYVLSVYTDDGWCGEFGNVTWLLPKLPRTETGYWTDYEGERRLVTDGPHRATYLETF